MALGILHLPLLVAALSVAQVSARSYPVRLVRMVVGFAPGGGPDIVARILSDPLGARLGQSVVVDNRAGANGIVGAEIVSRSPADGHTFLVTSASFAITRTSTASCRSIPSWTSLR